MDAAPLGRIVRHTFTERSRRRPGLPTTGAAVNQDVKLGYRLRAARVERRLSMDEVAHATGLTKGFLSQLERDLTSASVATLIKICNALQISVGSLFDPVHHHLVRAKEKPRINFGGDHLVEYLLTPAESDRLQVIESYLDPSGGSGDEAYSLNADVEAVHVLAGKVEIEVHGVRHLLQTGDTLTFSARDPHTWRNPSPREPAHVIWILAPSPW